MKITKTNINDVYVIENQTFGDERGWFSETFRFNEFNQIVPNISFVQCNESFSTHNILRGIHFQNPNSQGKLVRVVRGEVFDVAVDLRQKSSTFLQWYGIILSESNKKQLWIPPGFGHGFYVTGDCAHFVYSCTDYYNKDAEHCLKYDDPKVNIQWPIKPSVKPVLSAKDENSLSSKELIEQNLLF